ncbi:MAG: hypothetical protein IPN82_00650 [Chitinophagaceae bacterium]|nr:hypothetical protein [Chitinophagaceae bacterium]
MHRYDLNKQWLIPALQASRSATEFARKNKHYIDADLILWSDHVFKLQGESKLDEALQFCDNLIAVERN